MYARENARPYGTLEKGKKKKKERGEQAYSLGRCTRLVYRPGIVPERGIV